MTSRTRFWAPNPTASPRMPAPARIRVMSNPSWPRPMTPTTAQISTAASVWRRLTSVVTRFRVAPGTVSVASPALMSTDSRR